MPSQWQGVVGNKRGFRRAEDLVFFVVEPHNVLIMAAIVFQTRNIMSFSNQSRPLDETNMRSGKGTDDANWRLGISIVVRAPRRRRELVKPPGELPVDKVPDPPFSVSGSCTQHSSTLQALCSDRLTRASLDNQWHRKMDSTRCALRYYRGVRYLPTQAPQIGTDIHFVYRIRFCMPTTTL